MKSILVTGCNRGLGLGLIKNLLSEINPPTIIATCRNIANAKELQKVADKNSNIHILEFDVAKFDTYETFSKKVSETVKDKGLNVLFNNAGISPKSTRINFVKAEQMIETFTVNTVAPVMLTKTLLPLLKKAAGNVEGQTLSCRKAVIVNMTSILGSISLNSDGGLYPYRCSKAALNMATKSLSKDLSKDGILVTCIHPGWVKTDMGGPNAPLDVNEVTLKLVKFLNELNESHHGLCFQYDGKLLDW